MRRPVFLGMTGTCLQTVCPGTPAGRIVTEQNTAGGQQLWCCLAWTCKSCVRSRMYRTITPAALTANLGSRTITLATDWIGRAA